MVDKVIKGRSTVMACEMKKLINNQLMSDVQFEISPERKLFYGHKCILTARCEIFKLIFVDQMSRKDSASPLVLQEMKPNIFKYLLEYLYKNQIKLEKSFVNETIELFAITMEFGLDNGKIVENYCSCSYDNRLINENCRLARESRPRIDRRKSATDRRDWKCQLCVSRSIVRDGDNDRYCCQYHTELSDDVIDRSHGPFEGPISVWRSRVFRSN